MSNEKPVRITVGDVKEVTEATTIQEDTVKPVSTVASSPASTYTPSVDNSGGNGVVMIGAVIALILIIIAGVFASQFKPAAATDHNAPALSGTNAPAANTPATANNEPASNNAPAANNEAPATNAPAANSEPAADAPAGNNEPAANNAA